MVRLVEESVAGGALGFSSSLGEGHLDGDHRQVPSRAAGFEEFVALAGALRGHPGTTLEFIPTVGPIPEDRMRLMADMSLAADRPLNWNLLGSLSSEEIYEQQLRASDVAAEAGAHVVALALPDMMRMRATNVLGAIPGWRDVLDLDDGARRSAVADPATRAVLRAGAEQSADRAIGVLSDFAMMEVADPGSEWVGRSLGSIAEQRGTDVVDVLIDVVLSGSLTLFLVLPSLAPSLGHSDEGWAVRTSVWRDPRVLLGGSDAGAHLDLMCHANYPTVVLGQVVRDRGLLSVEEAVAMMTDRPARHYGLRERGRIAVGWHADLVVFDPATVGSHPVSVRRDLPGGGERLWAGSEGIGHVFVAGSEVVADGAVTDRRPGSVLRSGRDTETVTPGRRPTVAGGPTMAGRSGSGRGGAVDDQGGPADRGGVVRCQVGHGRGHLGRVDQPAHGRCRSGEQGQVGTLGNLEVPQEGGVDRCRADRVDAHPGLGQLDGHRLGEHDHTALGGAVGGVVRAWRACRPPSPC